MDNFIVKRSFLDRVTHQIATCIENWGYRQRFRIELEQAKAEIDVVSALLLEFLSDKEKEGCSIETCEVHYEGTPGYMVSLCINANIQRIVELNCTWVKARAGRVRYVSGNFQEIRKNDKT